MLERKTITVSDDMYRKLEHMSKVLEIPKESIIDDLILDCLDNYYAEEVHSIEMVEAASDECEELWWETIRKEKDWKDYE